jgi:hypothetical protein
MPVMLTIESHLHFRLATKDDISLIGPLIEASVRGLSTREYSPSQIDHALGTWLGLDTQLIADETYYVVEPTAHSRACWSHAEDGRGEELRTGAIIDQGATTRCSIREQRRLRFGLSLCIRLGPGAVSGAGCWRCAKLRRGWRALRGARWARRYRECHCTEDMGMWRANGRSCHSRTAKHCQL